MTHLFSIPAGAEWMLLLLLVLIAANIYYILTLQSVFKAISPENRKMPSGYVWLLLVPIFSFVWHFNVVSKLSESIRAEADTHNITITEAKPAYYLGLAMCILICCSYLPVVGIFATMASLIIWIIYWVKIISYKRLLLKEKNIALR